MQAMQEFISRRINFLMENHPGRTKYRKPLVGFAPANSPRFKLLRQVAHPGHMLPGELLPGAQSVAAFFLPFAAEIVTANREAPGVAREWAVAYIETNAFISEISAALHKDLQAMGVASAYAEPTHNFDLVELVSFWSHKHVAWAAGLGRFGQNQLLITPAGCAGRFGSLVLANNITDKEPQLAEEGCLSQSGRKCGQCIRSCPSGALSNQGLDKARCYEYLLQIDADFADLATCDVCGKCALGPCALRSF